MIRYILTLFLFFLMLIHSALIYPLYFLSGRRIGKNIAGDIFRMVLWINRVKLDVNGRENVDPLKKYLVVSNHQSVFDIPIVGAALGIDIRIFAKKELSRIPLFGQLLYLYDFVFVDRENKREAVKNLKKAGEVMKKHSFLVFPEGTRSSDGKVGSFKTGAVSLAQGRDIEVLPVAILNSCEIMPKGKLIINPGTVKVRIFEPIIVDNTIKRKELALKLQSIISDYIENN